MAKQKIYTCTQCNASQPKWAGQCDGCGAWNTLQEDKPLGAGPAKKSLGGMKGQLVPLTDLASQEPAPPRTLAGVGELDRVLGGGLVQGSALLVGGDPGIGKSTLMLQAAARFARNGLKVIYISGEESASQVQMRSSAHELTSFAKQRNIAMIMVGHVTKDGNLAGPRVVEHMVDTVLYFEGERGHQFRILRSVKNRFGPADEIGVFEMTGKGLSEVKNPSALFLSDRGKPAPGSVVFAGIEGTRPMLGEIQALVSPSPQPNAKRSCVGQSPPKWWFLGKLASLGLSVRLCRPKID